MNELSAVNLYIGMWFLVPIFAPVLGIKIGVLVIVLLKSKVYVEIQQHIGLKYSSPYWGFLQALAVETNYFSKRIFFHQEEYS